MDTRGAAILRRMAALFNELVGGCPRGAWCPSCKRRQLEDIRERRVYVFYENDKPLYVRFAFKEPQSFRTHYFPRSLW